MKKIHRAHENRRGRFWLVTSIGMVILACAPLFAPVPPTMDPNSINTAIAGTAAAASTLTALLTPPTWTSTVTPISAVTPSATPSPTETFIFLLFSPTSTNSMTPTVQPTQNYACKVVAQTPVNGTVFSRRAAFSVRWTVVNAGFKTWGANDSDYVYASGEKMHDQNGYDLNSTVEPGKSVDLVVAMQAPSQKGNYTTNWQLRVENVRFCSLRLIIEVQ